MRPYRYTLTLSGISLSPFPSLEPELGALELGEEERRGEERLSLTGS